MSPTAIISVACRSEHAVRCSRPSSVGLTDEPTRTASLILLFESSGYPTGKPHSCHLTPRVQSADPTGYFPPVVEASGGVRRPHGITGVFGLGLWRLRR